MAAELGWRTQGGRHRMDVLGVEITVTTQPWRDELWTCARTSEDLNHNWLSELLRALRGQLICRRLEAREFSDGRAIVWVRTATALARSLGGCASQLEGRSAAAFWALYAAYLAYVSQHRGADGQPGFEANDLTQLHDEVIQARRSGSPWVDRVVRGQRDRGPDQPRPGIRVCTRRPHRRRRRTVEVVRIKRFSGASGRPG